VPINLNFSSFIADMDETEITDYPTFLDKLEEEIALFNDALDGLKGLIFLNKYREDTRPP
jgi:hypothetical protein